MKWYFAPQAPACPDSERVSRAAAPYVHVRDSQESRLPKRGQRKKVPRSHREPSRAEALEADGARGSLRAPADTAADLLAPATHVCWTTALKIVSVTENIPSFKIQPTPCTVRFWPKSSNLFCSAMRLLIHNANLLYFDDFIRTSGNLRARS